MEFQYVINASLPALPNCTVSNQYNFKQQIEVLTHIFRKLA